MKRLIQALALVLALPLLAAAQAKTTTPPQGQKLVLEFVSGTELSVILADKTILAYGSGIIDGDPIPVGAVIKTGPTTSAELKLAPNGSIIKLAKATTFTVAGLASAPTEKNAFAVAAGKVRAVAAKGGQYEFRSGTAVCGVRGTDFVFDVIEGAKARLVVAEGLVEFARLDPATGAILGNALSVASGMAADAFASVFESLKLSDADLAEALGDVGFERLKAADVAAAAAPEAPKEPAEAEPADDKPAAAKEQSAFAKWLSEALGMEIGSVTIDSQTYAKAVIQPTIKLGKLKLGLYLPIIYSSNLFDPADWYRPGGNDEWSFGSGQWGVDNGAAAIDAAKDLALKIRFLEYGRQLEDPFFVKIGNLQGLTLGHGLIMRNYANDTEFPSVRRIGLNLGFDFGKVGFEALANDLAAPEIFGGRFYFRPIPNFKLAFGLSAAADIAPASSLANRDTIGDPALIGAGLDLDLPILTGDFLGLRFFADAATTLPYLRSAVGGQAGLRTDVLIQGGELQNWGAASGFMGRVAFFEWRLEYRYSTGIFRSSFFDSTYDRKRAEYALAYYDYLLSPSVQPTVMGIYGEGGFSLMKDKLGFQVGYFWPWSLEMTSLAAEAAKGSDELHAKLWIKKGLIPVIDVAGGIFYDRRGLAKAIVGNDFRLFDESTVFGGEIVVPVPKTPNLDLAVLFATVPVRNADGTISWKDQANGIPNVKPSISIETRLHF